MTEDRRAAPVATAEQEPSTEARYQIGEVAERTGVTQRTLRFYEEKGLLTPADRMDGGFRLYSDADVVRIEMIRQLQQLLGFTLAEIKEMVDAEAIRAHLRSTESEVHDPGDIRERIGVAAAALHRQLEVVEPKIEQLLAMRDDLYARLARCDERLRELEAPAAR